MSLGRLGQLGYELVSWKNVLVSRRLLGKLGRLGELGDNLVSWRTTWRVERQLGKLGDNLVSWDDLVSSGLILMSWGITH